MKTDETIMASGYSSVLGFNLRQTIRAQRKIEKAKVSEKECQQLAKKAA